MKLPLWYPKATREQRFNYLIQLAALHASADGSLSTLASKLNMTPGTISIWKRSGKIPVVRVAMDIEKLAGREIVTWESLVNPASAIQQQ